LKPGFKRLVLIPADKYAHLHSIGLERSIQPGNHSRVTTANKSQLIYNVRTGLQVKLKWLPQSLVNVRIKGCSCHEAKAKVGLYPGTKVP
jgi:hypothetical protein